MVGDDEIEGSFPFQNLEIFGIDPKLGVLGCRNGLATSNLGVAGGVLGQSRFQIFLCKRVVNFEFQLGVFAAGSLCLDRLLVSSREVVVENECFM